jgi:hypothetical protein
MERQDLLVASLTILLVISACSNDNSSTPDVKEIIEESDAPTPTDSSRELPLLDTHVEEVSDATRSPDVLAGEISIDAVGDSSLDVEAKAEVQQACLATPAVSTCTEDDFPVPPEGVGLNPLEIPHFEAMSTALLALQNIFFVDTFHPDTGLYEVRWADGYLLFKRSFDSTGPLFEVVELEGENPFGCTDPAGFNTYDAALEAGTNPMETTYEELGYAADDPRVTFIPTEDHCYPFPYLRISQLYDAANAPDFHYSATPWGVGSGGSHGALDVIQARTPLVIAGAGLRQGFESEATPKGVDIAPTILHLLGATPELGLKHGLECDETYLKWQDGEALDGLWEEEACVEPFQFAFIFLYDGLNSNELVHLYESQDVALPGFFDIMDEALIFRNGAITGFPTVSVPGHLSVGTGMLNGHHNFIGNGFYYRVEQQILSPGNIIAEADRYLADPQLALDLFDFIMNPDGETIFEAATRHFGDGIFTASVNELTLRGAQHSLIDMAAAFAGGARADYYELADQVAIPQVLGLLDEHAESGKKMLFFVSMYTTDDSGEHGGPHGGELRNKLVSLDLYMSKFLERLDSLNIRDKSVIVLTADHGMELQDKSRSGGWQGAMQGTGVKYLDPDGFGFVYLPVLEPICQAVNCGPGGCVASILVTDADTGIPVEGAGIMLESPASPVSETDADGMADFALGENQTATLMASHSEYNQATFSCAGVL